MNKGFIRHVLKLFFFLALLVPAGQGIARADQGKVRAMDEKKLEALRKSEDFDYIRQADELGSFWGMVEKFLAKLFDFGYNDKSKGVWTFVFYIVLGLSVIYIVWKWVHADKTWFLKQKGKGNTSEVDIPDENIHEIDFSKIILESISERDFRRAVRYLYLLSLKELTDRNFIQWQPGKTNEVYIRELRPAELKSQLSRNTYLYEYIWYGNFQMDEALFKTADQSFTTFIERIKSTNR